MTPFQEQRLNELERTPGFEQFCLDPRKISEQRPAGPFTVLFYQDSVLKGERIGQNKVLWVKP